MLIKILNIGDQETRHGPKTEYKMFKVDYSCDGKAATKTFISFSRPDIYAKMLAASPGQMYEVTQVKGEKYFEWTSVTLVESGSAPKTGTSVPKTGTVDRKSTYETPEERAAKQIYIVRQSSISAAVNYAAAVKASPTVASIIATAREFEKYVFEDSAVGFEDPFKDDTEGIV